MSKQRASRLGLPALVLAPLLLAVVGWSHIGPVRAGAKNFGQRLAQDDADRRARQSNLRGRLSSTSGADFLAALRSLASMDEPGVLELWTVAINNPDPDLARHAWQGFPAARAVLSRKESAPQIARVNAGHDVVASTVEAAGLELQILADDLEGTVVATPPYGLDRLRSAGLAVTKLFDSVAELQRAS